MKMNVSEKRIVVAMNYLSELKLVKNHGEVEMSIDKGDAIIFDEDGNELSRLKGVKIMCMNRGLMIFDGYALVPGGVAEFRRWYVS